MAKGKGIGEMQRGITFSTVTALCVSVLILIVGSGMKEQQSSGSFTISSLSDFIETYVGEAGVVVFAVGFIAAALSSMLTVPLGAALTADGIFSDEEVTNEEVTNQEVTNEEVTTVNKGRDSSEDLLETEGQKLPRSAYLAINLIIVLVATVVIALNGNNTNKLGLSCAKLRPV